MSSRRGRDVVAPIVRRFSEHLRLPEEDCDALLAGVSDDVRLRALVDLEMLARTHPLPTPHPALRGVLEELHEFAGSNEFTVKELRSAAERREKLRNAVQPVGGQEKTGQKLGAFLTKWEGHVVNGLAIRVVRKDDADGNVYAVVTG